MKTESEFLRIGLRAGLVTLEEVEQWAAENLETNPDQEDVLTELLIARVNGKYETGQLLSLIQGEFDWSSLEIRIRNRVKEIYRIKGRTDTIPLIERVSIVASEFPRNSKMANWSSILESRRQLFLDGFCDFSEVETHFKDFLSDQKKK